MTDEPVVAEDRVELRSHAELADAMQTPRLLPGRAGAGEDAAARDGDPAGRRPPPARDPRRGGVDPPRARRGDGPPLPRPGRAARGPRPGRDDRADQGGGPLRPGPGRGVLDVRDPDDHRGDQAALPRPGLGDPGAATAAGAAADPQPRHRRALAAHRALSDGPGAGRAPRHVGGRDPRGPGVRAGLRHPVAGRRQRRWRRRALPAGRRPRVPTTRRWRASSTGSPSSRCWRRCRRGSDGS